MNVATNWVERRFEFQADKFYCQTPDRCEALASALVKLNAGSIRRKFQIYDPVYSAWHLTQPSLLERLAAIRAIKEALEKNE